MNRKTKFAIGSAVIVLAVATLIYSAVRETSAYFLTMEEYAAARGRHDGQSLRLAGRVAPGTVQWNPRTLDLRLLLREGGPNLVDMAEPQLYVRACRHGWDFACERVSASR